MKIKTKIILFTIFILIAIQFMPINKNINTNHIVTLSENIPNDVSSILKESCYDCHSYNT